ncbi:hypothetical protein HR060_13095 [Catenovulum sp. SM1970]|nr:hypothetical protein [Marinifaba aquimaris]
MQLALFTSNANAEAVEKYVDISLRDDVYTDYLVFLNDRDVLSIDSFEGVRIRRDVVDMIIAQQALALGGFQSKFNYFPGRSNYRNAKLLEQGSLLISFDTYWLEDAKAIDYAIFVSEPVIRKGEYVAGIYANPKNESVFNILYLEDLNQFTAVSTPKWKTDWATLSSLPLKELIREDRWLGMARMVDKMWVDFMLMPFYRSEDKIYRLENITLKPVENVAVVLNDSRHFVISRAHPLGSEAFSALQKGLKILREQKKIARAYKEAGFFIDRNKYKILNPVQ